MNCPKCGTENSDDWPVEVHGEIVDGGCQNCWEKYTNQEWWKMIDEEVNCCTKIMGAEIR